MNDRIRRHIGVGWDRDEWQLEALAHPIGRLLLMGRKDEADKLARDYAIAHEAGHACLALSIGIEVNRVVIAHLHEIGSSAGGGTIGFVEHRSRVKNRTETDVLGELLMCVAGIAGHETVYGNGWGLDPAAWTAPGDVNGSLRDEVMVGGDLHEARELVRVEVRVGRSVMGHHDVAGALLAAYEQVDAILMGWRGRLLRLCGHLGAYGSIDREKLYALWQLPE